MLKTGLVFFKNPWLRPTSVSDRRTDLLQTYCFLRPTGRVA